MLVTVIIPVAKAHVKYLPQALKSLEAQTVQHHQVIVVNDSGEPLDVPGVIHTKGYEGQSRARNMAIDRVTTPFVMFLDADDLMMTTTIETLLRAYADPGYNANYLYGDSIQWDGNRETYYTAPAYNRYALFTNNLHNVTCLLPTESVRAVGGFDEKIKGWEDWEFFIRMNVNGFCGARVPFPLITYQTHLGISRENHRKSQGEIFEDIRQVYGDYIDRKVELMGCGNCNDKAKQAAQGVQFPPVVGDGFALLEFLGEQQGSISFRVNGNVYRGANNPEDKFAKVAVQDVQQLLGTGAWRKVPSSALQARKPENVTVIEEAKPSLATSPGLKPCHDCGHLSIFHSEKGCQALMGSDTCGCKVYRTEEVAEKKVRARRRTKAEIEKERNERSSNTAVPG